MIVLVFDTETTGLVENPAKRIQIQPEIISFASANVNLKTGDIYDRYDAVFKPKTSISQEITKITGFTNSSVEGMPPIEDHINDIVNLLQAAPIIMGMNIEFDKSMIELECKRYFKKIRWPYTVDLIAQSIHTRGYRLSLTNLHLELFGGAFEGAHTALEDVEATCRCAIEMWKRGML